MPSDAPQACRHYGHWRRHRHWVVVVKLVRDHRADAVVAIRYRYTG